MGTSSATARFSAADRERLLRVKGVGPTVVGRLEELGITSLAQLAGENTSTICMKIAGSLGSTCWKNSPMARAAIDGAIAAAREYADDSQ